MYFGPLPPSFTYDLFLFCYAHLVVSPAMAASWQRPQLQGRMDRRDHPEHTCKLIHLLVSFCSLMIAVLLS